ncbi:MAG: DUF4369 domain-containing protein, partial [Bacteroidales bacterium]|nr:DUF4369 domain-containing protein [Bacteroidales bacterium]
MESFVGDHLYRKPLLLPAVHPWKEQPMKPLTALSKICLILLSCIGLAACERQQLTVSGHLEDCNENYLFLDEITPDGINILDTILIMGGDFKYPIKKKEESLYRLRLNDTNFISFMGKRGDKVEISGNAQDLAHTYQISGNEASKVLREVSQRVDIMYQITDSLSKL